MILKVFAVYDSAISAYAQPFFLLHKGEALRGWIDAVNDPSTKFYKHPADYTLFEIGDYDDSTGKIQNSQTPQPLGTALEFRKAEPQRDLKVASS